MRKIIVLASFFVVFMSALQLNAQVVEAVEPQEPKVHVKAVTGEDVADEVKVEAVEVKSVDNGVEQTENSGKRTRRKYDWRNRLTLGGYAEAFFTRNFYSDAPYRYSHAADYRDAKGHGRVDLPHAVINLGFDFGRGWSFSTEIEFEHGGIESAVELEADEFGEFEAEVERGGEVALEQLWIQKSFFKWLNIRAGHLVVPVGQTNNAHLPTEFFTAYRPEGEFYMMPCTWHETGLSVWGKVGDWFRYEAMIIPSLNSAMFNNSTWVKGGSASPFEFKVANNLAGVLRTDFYPVAGLHLGASGFIGNTFNNDIETIESGKYEDVKGLLAIGTFEADYRNFGLVARANFDYGYLDESNTISAYNKNLTTSTFSPYPRTLVGQSAMAVGGELAYDVLNEVKMKHPMKLYLFGRYDYYDTYIPAEGTANFYTWTEKHVMTAGINFYPMKEIVVKAEFKERFFKKEYGYNNEPAFSIGVAYSGFFIKPEK